MKLGKRGVEDRVEYDWSETEDEKPGGWPWQKRRGAEASASDDPEGSDLPDIDEFEDDEDQSTRSWLPIALGVLLVGAFLFRFSAAEHISSHIDEGASIMAAHAVAEKGVPIFPSGTLYLQGGTLSYILAPVVWAGYGDLDDLTVMRFPSVVAGTVAVLFMFLFGRFVTGSAVTGYLGAVLLAFDPLSVRWSGHVRMYALLQLCTLCFLWLFFRAVLGPPNRRLLAVMVGVFWFSVFTHIATLLVWPGMVICAFIVHGWSLCDRRRDLTIALGACLGAPFVMLMLNQLVEPPDQAVNQTVPGVSFVGDYFLSIRQILHPNIQPFLLLFRRTGLTQIMPYVMVGMTCLLLGRYFLVPNLNRLLRSRRRIIGLLLILYWLPIAFVTAFTTGAEERYLMHVQPVGFLLIAILVIDLVSWVWQRGVPAVPTPIPALASSNGYATIAATNVRAWHPARTSAPGADDEWSYERTKRPKKHVDEEVVVRPLPQTLALAGLAVLAIGGAVLRLVHLNALSLWLDEGFTVLYSRLSWSSVLGFNGYYSPHPPLFFALVKAVSDLIGDEYAARTISVVCAIATLPVFYAIVSRLLDRRASLVATTILAISPMNVYYAQEGRMYALLVFLVSLTYLALVGFWQQPGWRWAVLYGVAGALAMWVDYSAVYVLLPQAIPLGMLTWKYRMRARPLFIAIIGAGIAYLPWLPRVFDTVSSANEETRRESYLGAQSDRVGNALLSIVGLGGDNSYFYGSEQAPWNRFPDLRLLFMLAFLPIIVLGVIALWRRSRALTVAGCLFAGTLIVAIVISQISPGFAERTVLSATLGWALLIGAAFREGVRRNRLLVAAGSLAVVVLASGLTLGALYGGAQKQDWRGAAQAVAETQPWGMPFVTYSYGAVADTLIDVYEPGLLGVMRHVTIRDGDLENTLSGGVLREVGLTRGDLAAGKLGEVLPASDPTTGAVWYLYPPRTGETEVHAAFLAQGYERVYRRLFDHPRYKIWLDLYVRPGDRLGNPIAINGTFADGATGWTLPASGASVVADETGSGGNQLVLTNAASKETVATLDVPAQGEGLYTVGTDVLTDLDLSTVQVRVTCLAADESALVTSTAEMPQAAAGQTEVTRRAVAWCPERTMTVRFAVATNGDGASIFRNATMDFLPVVKRIPEGEQG